MLCLFTVRTRYSQWQSAGSPLGFVAVSSGPQMQPLGLAAGVHRDGNPGQCVLWSTVIFVQLRF